LAISLGIMHCFFDLLFDIAYNRPFIFIVIFKRGFMIYAVIKNGTKQYRVSEGQTIEFEKIIGEIGSKVEFDKVLMLVNGEDVKFGEPLIANAKAVGEIVKHGRHEKINVIKFRRRKHHMKRIGHRQHYTTVKIITIK